QFEDGVQNLVLEAVQTYYNLLLSKKLLKVYQDDLQVAQTQYDQDKTLYENGLKTRSDLLSSETNWRSSQLSLFSAQNDYENALKNFNIALNRPVQSPAELDDHISEEMPKMLTLDADLTSALAHRYDARTRRLRLRQSDVSQTLENLNTLPLVFVDLFASTGRGFNSHELWEYNYGISAGISFDIGFFYLDKYRTRQNIRLSNDNAHLEYEQFLRSLRDSVVEARNALLLKMRSLEISKLRLQAAEQKFEATQLKYKNGLMSATDLTVARQEMISAQVSYATLVCELTISRLRYRYALGEQIYDYKPENI
ncbi:MAG: TolC family protein, partial [Candidatus Avelusimicrobium sp.]